MSCPKPDHLMRFIQYIKTNTHNELEAEHARSAWNRCGRNEGSQCKAREDEEWRYSLIRGEMASPQVLRYGPC